MGIIKHYKVSDFLRAEKRVERFRFWPPAPVVKVNRPQIRNSDLKVARARNEFSLGFSRFRKIHGALADKPVGSRFTLSLKSKSGVTRHFVYEKKSSNVYSLVSRAADRGEK